MNEIDAGRYLRRKTGCYLYIGHDLVHATFNGKAYKGGTFVDLVRDLQKDDPLAPVVDIEKAKP